MDVGKKFFFFFFIFKNTQLRAQLIFQYIFALLNFPGNKLFIRNIRLSKVEFFFCINNSCSTDNKSCTRNNNSFLPPLWCYIDSDFAITSLLLLHAMSFKWRLKDAVFNFTGYIFVIRYVLYKYILASTLRIIRLAAGLFSLHVSYFIIIFCIIHNKLTIYLLGRYKIKHLMVKQIFDFSQAFLCPN